MPGIVIGEVSSTSNPLLPFFYQWRGILADVYSIRYEVYTVGDTTVIKEDDLDMRLSPDGDKKATGYYVAPLDPEDLEMDAGSYEILFYYKTTETADEKSYGYGFEVLEKSTFRRGSAYKAYIPSSHTALEGFSTSEKQMAIYEASKFVDFLTGREFFPRYFDLLHTMQEDQPTIWLFIPVIGINEVAVTTLGVVSGTADDYLIDLTSLRVYNRHLSGMLVPDDRADPRIALELADPTDRFFLCNVLPQGELNVRVTGVFGYTDPDDSPIGMTPLPLQFVVQQLAYRKLVDPMATDPTLWNPAMVKKAKTRDQEIHFDNLISSNNAELTGNSKLDSILAQYMRPCYVGAV